MAVVVPCLLLSGEIVSVFPLLMGTVSMYNLIVKLNDMKGETLNDNHVMMKSKVNLKIILWWAGAFLGKSLRDIMDKALSCCNLDSELPRLA